MSIPPARVMSELTEPFTVRTRRTGEEYHVRFSHLFSAIATRHSDTLDCKFVVNGRGLVVALALPAFVEFHQRAGRPLTDQEAAYLAAAWLREYLEADNDASLSPLYVSREEVLRLAGKLRLL